MMNRFQKYFTTPEGIVLAKQMVKEFYPNIKWSYISPYSGKRKECKIEIDFQYDWVKISCKGADFGIEFYNDLSGTGHDIDAFVIMREKSMFRIWRFNNDPKVNEKLPVYEHLVKDIPKPTPEEMYEYYYSD